MHFIRRRHLLLIVSAIHLATGAASAAPSEASTRIAAVLSKQESYFVVKILAVREKAVTELTTKYLAAIKAEQERVMAAGNLEGAVEARDELRRLEKGDPFPDTEGPPHSKVPELRSVYRAQLEALNEMHRKQESTYLEIVDNKLAELEAEYTRAKEIPSAKEVRGTRDRLKVEGLPYLSNGGRKTPNAGRLRAFSNVRAPYERLDISKAEPFDDFIQVVNLSENHWAALRATGDVVSSAAVFDGRQGIAALTSKALLHKDGRIEILRDHGKGFVVEKGGKALISTSAVTVALTEGGGVRTWGRIVNRDDYTLPPEDLAGAIAVGATHGYPNARSYAVLSDGSVVTWGEKNFESFLPERIPDLVQLDAGWLHFAALTKDGSVMAWPPGRPWTRIPDDLPRIIGINAQCNITAVQKEDLSWQAWGDRAMGVREQINQIGPAIAIAYEANGRGWGYVLWIEPPK